MNKKKFFKLILFILILCLFGYIIYSFMPFFMTLKTPEGRDNFSNEIKALGAEGPIAIALLAMCKAIVVFLPGEPIEIISGMCFGGLFGWLIVYSGYFISSLVIAFLVKKFGRSFVKEFVTQEKIDKVEKTIKENPNKYEITLFFLYFLPIVPKDLLAYIGCLLSISIRKFLFISMFARIPATLSSTIVGAHILDGDWMVIVTTYSITYAISGILAIIYKKFFTKEKRIQKKLKKEKSV